MFGRALPWIGLLVSLSADGQSRERGGSDACGIPRSGASRPQVAEKHSAGRVAIPGHSNCLPQNCQIDSPVYLAPLVWTQGERGRITRNVVLGSGGAGN